MWLHDPLGVRPRNSVRAKKLTELGASPSTVVAEMIAELKRFEPDICISNRNKLDLKRESASVMRDIC